MTNYINLLVEGATDEMVAKKLLSYIGLELGTCYGRQGKGYIEKNIRGFANAAVKPYPTLCLIDLDDHPCPVTYRDHLLNNYNKEAFTLRIAVRCVESWLLADYKTTSQFFNIPIKQLPDPVEACLNPKTELISLVKRFSNRELQKDIVPAENSFARQGPAYVDQISRYLNVWNINEARKNSPSLERTIIAVLKYFT
jgi:hypothetical protein